MGYTITKVAWYTQRPDLGRPREDVLTQFRTLARFLDAHGLSTRRLLDPPEREIGDDFAVTSDDVTEEGMEFFRGGYERWLNALDRGKSPADASFLERALAKQRGTAPAPKRRGGRKPGDPRAPAPPERPPERDEPRVYDEAKWHLEGDWPEGLGAAQAYVHAGLYLGWLVERGLTSAAFRFDFPELLAAFRAREKTGPELYALAGGVLASDMLDGTGDAFTRAYFDPERGGYLEDYAALLARDLPTAYHVPDTWGSYERLRAQLDARFAEWQRGAGRGDR